MEGSGNDNPIIRRRAMLYKKFCHKGELSSGFKDIEFDGTAQLGGNDSKWAMARPVAQFLT